MLGGGPAFGQGQDHWEMLTDRLATVSGLGVPWADRATRVMTPHEFTSHPWAGHVLPFCPDHSSRALCSPAQGHTPVGPHGHGQLW